MSHSSVQDHARPAHGTGIGQADSSEQGQVIELNESGMVDREDESLIESSSASATDEHYSQHRRSFDGSPICVILFVLVPAVIGLAIFGVYELYDDSKTGSGDTKQKNGFTTSVVPTILISIDGFRHDYLYRTRQSSGDDGHNKSVALAPNLQRLCSRGVTASPGMQPVMPTITFPNHWSIATGLYAESHGIVGNTMYDFEKQEWFHYSSNSSHWWSGEPIWQTIRQTPRLTTAANGTRVASGDNFTTASVFFVGSDVQKHAPNVYWDYDPEVPYERRVERVMSLLTGDARDLDGRADFVTTYFESVDHAGHKHGPDSAEVDAEIANVDQTIGSLLTKLEQAFGENYNILVVSDHGMSEVDSSREINLTAAIPEGTVQDIERTPFGMWLNVSEPADRVYSKIKRYLSKSGLQASVYRKQELPQRWHLSRSAYIPEVVTVAKLGWSVKYAHQKLVPGARLAGSLRGKASHGGASRYKRNDAHRKNEQGSHGYDNEELEMYAMFIAAGPGFQSGKVVSGLRSVDVYPMICHLFGATAAPNNGSLDISMKHVLAQ